MAVLTLKRFLDELAEKLAGLSDGEVRAVLLRYAAEVAPADRSAFLDDLAAAVVAWRSDKSGVPAGELRGDADLLGDIDAFTADLAAGVYFDGYEWDHDVRRERAFGDESWAPRMDGLFRRTHVLFTNGQQAQARTAYGALFEALGMEDDEGGPFSGEDHPAQMLQVDVFEAAARYLRTVYDTEADSEQRAAALARAWLDEIPSGYGPRNLAEVREVLPHDLRDLEEFAPRWTAHLIERRSAEHGPGHFIRDVSLLHELVTEAALASGGTDALAQVARAGGSGQAEAYLVWIDALRGDGRATEAEAACLEAMEAAPDAEDWTRYHWARIPERAAALARARGDGEAETRYLHRALDLAPDTERLCALYTAAERHRAGHGPHRAGQAADALATRHQGRLRQRHRIPSPRRQAHAAADAVATASLAAQYDRTTPPTMAVATGVRPASSLLASRMISVRPTTYTPAGASNPGATGTAG